MFTNDLLLKIILSQIYIYKQFNLQRPDNGDRRVSVKNWISNASPRTNPIDMNYIVAMGFNPLQIRKKAQYREVGVPTPTIKKQSWNSTIPIIYDDVKVVDRDFGLSIAEYAIHFVCQ